LHVELLHQGERERETASLVLPDKTAVVLVPL
jgi:hypothetical protein